MQEKMTPKSQTGVKTRPPKHFELTRPAPNDLVERRVKRYPLNCGEGFRCGLDVPVDAAVVY